MTTTIRIIEADRPIDEPAEDGFGALSTSKGNLPLSSIDVALSVCGLAVRTELTQGFSNPYDEPLEATYIFPLPPRAAVTGLRMEADDRVVDGVLRERERARADYDAAIAEGKRASIAEEERPGVFTMRVGNILPGERVSVRLTLAGRAEYADGEATIRFPLVVAPRYIPGAPLDGGDVGSGVEPDTDAVPDASRITPPVLLPGFPNPVDLSIGVDIDPAGLPLSDVASTLHPVDVDSAPDPEGSRKMRVRVHPGERADRDFIMRLRLGAPDAVSSSLVLVPDAEPDATGTAETTTAGESAEDLGTGSFALTLLPPTADTPDRPRDVVFVLDRSGSMRGWKMVAARRAAGRIVDSLTAADRFAVLAFDNRIETPIDLPDGLVEATDRNRFRAVEYLARTEARGGTEMLEPLLTAARLLGDGAPAERGDRDRIVVLVTDGQVGDEDQLLHELSGRLAGARVHAVGIDRAVNEGFLQRLVRIGDGRCELVESEDRLDEAMEAIHRRIASPVVTDLRLAGEGLDLVGDSLAPAPLPSLYAGASVVITGRYRPLASGSSGSPAARMAIRVIGQTAGAARAERVTGEVGDNRALAAVWARARLRDLEDRYVATRGSGPALTELEKRIVATSLRFGVLCRFTAFVAIDTRVVVEPGSEPRRVTQPVELPQGWELPDQPGVMPMAHVGGLSGVAGVAMTDAAMPGPFARQAGPATGDFSPTSRLRGVPKSPRSPAGGRTREGGRRMRPEGGADGSAPSGSKAWTLAAALRTELLAADPTDPTERHRLLVSLRPRLTELVSALQAAGNTDPAARLRAVVEELASADPAIAPADAAAADRWQRLLDLLTELTGDAAGAPGTIRSRRGFWRRR